MTDAPALVLLGVSGSGKTAVGRILAESMSLPLVEADELVARESGRTVAELVIAGDPRLPDLRRKAAALALCSPGAIVTLGASQIADPDTHSRLLQAKEAGARVVELVADTAEVARREGLNKPRSVALGAPRAMLTRMIRELHAKYADVADSSVETGGLAPREVAEAVARACRLAGDSPNPRD